ncbi:hypothetical protein NEHOM01_2248 [Nematocida homosporus]|uniref:uncharacterized protein n=1 Tax=Nematocida homosporus TaxID=1912981 RepID=UPI002220DEF3|nr:uncharacterized protein NEHOM01_2248 [Nematocida homosporus]KAI5187529.1 hypothetical protein NEHOM01_2248 [Nematocida homosporus]
MERLRREGIVALEEILLRTEEILKLARIEISTDEKDIHREIKDAFQIKTKTELLISSLSTLYSAILEIESLQEESLLWSTTQPPSRAAKQQLIDRQVLLQWFNTTKTSHTPPGHYSPN